MNLCAIDCVLCAHPNSRTECSASRTPKATQKDRTANASSRRASRAADGCAWSTGEPRRRASSESDAAANRAAYSAADRTARHPPGAPIESFRIDAK